MATASRPKPSADGGQGRFFIGRFLTRLTIRMSSSESETHCGQWRVESGGREGSLMPTGVFARPTAAAPGRC